MWGDGGIPRWFEDWLRAEREATTLRIWQPLIVRGLLQTADYARALFAAPAPATSSTPASSKAPSGAATSSSAPTKTT